MKKLNIIPLEERTLFDVSLAGALLEGMADSASTTLYAEGYTLYDSMFEDPQGADVQAGENAPVRILLLPPTIESTEILAKAVSDNVQLITYESDTSPEDVLQGILEKIDATLGGQKADSIAFINHGQAASFQLSEGLSVNLDTLPQIETFWQDLGGFLSDSGRIDLLACDLGASEEGHALIQSLSVLTGAEVAASADTTGHESLGGDWELEIGDIHLDEMYFEKEALLMWEHTLATINVTVLEDRFDVDQAKSSNEYSLREALYIANNTEGDDEIILSNGAKFYLTVQGDYEDLGKTGDLDVLGFFNGGTEEEIDIKDSGKLTIRTANLDGEKAVVYGRSSGDPSQATFLNDRIFDVKHGAVLTLNNLKITEGGQNPDPNFEGPGFFGSGGGIQLEGSTNNTITTLYLYNSEVSNNYTSVGFSSGAGVQAGYLSKVTIKDSLIKDNKGYLGAGFYGNSATVQIENTSFENNTAYGKGAGVYVFGDNLGNGSLKVLNSSFTENKGGTGGFLTPYSTVLVSSLLQKNGGIGFVFENSTVSGNMFHGGAYGTTKNAGIQANNSDTVILNSTIVNNEVQNSEHVDAVGLYIFGINSSLKMYNTILAGNKSYSSGDPGYKYSNGSFDGESMGVSNNLFGQGVVSTFTLGTNETLTTDSEVLLESLSDLSNGTKGHLLKENSPAVDTGDNNLATDQEKDQGGEKDRIFNSTVDIGATEFGANITPTPTFDADPINLTLPQGGEFNISKFEATDPNGLPLTFTLEGSPPEGFTVASDGTINFDTNLAEPGNYVFNVVVTNENGESATQEVTLEIQENPLSLIGVEDLSIEQGKDFSLEKFEVQDAQGKDITFELDDSEESNPPAGFSVESDGTINFDTTNAVPGVYTFNVIVKSNDGLEKVEAVTIAITPDFTAIKPTITDDIVDAGDGKLSLREAITFANNGGVASTIILEGGKTYVINGDPGDDNNISGDFDVINNNLTIKTESAGDRVTIDGQGNDRIFQVTGVDFELENVDLTNAKLLPVYNRGGFVIAAEDSNLKLVNSIISDSYGYYKKGDVEGDYGSLFSILAEKSNVELTNVHIVDSIAKDIGFTYTILGILGNDVLVQDGDIKLNNSSASVVVGSVENETVIPNDHTVSLNNSTLFSAYIFGGSFESISSTFTAKLAIRYSPDVSILHSTVHAPFGAIIIGDKVTISHSIIYGNGIFITPSNLQTSNLTLNDSIIYGDNISENIEDIKEAGGATIENLITLDENTYVGLNSLADNGGPTQTHSLKPESLAINAGSIAGDFPDNDQRGEGFKRVQGGRIDIGAFESPNNPPEFQSEPLVVTVTLGNGLENQKFNVIDLDEQALEFNLEGNIPEGFSVNNEGEITFENSNTEGTFEFNIEVSDGESETIQAVKIVVVHPQSLSNVDNLNIKQGEVLQIQQLTVFDAQGKKLSFQLDETQESSHPKGFSVAPDGTITFDSKKAAPGTYTFNVLISDDEGLIRTEQVTLVINPDFDALRPTTNADVVSPTDRELSLREAITLANNSGGASTIILEGEGPYLNTLGSQFEVRNQNLSIKTESPDVIATINGQNRSRIFYASRVGFVLENVSLIYGDDGFYSGGAIYAKRSNVKLTNSTIYNTRGPNGSAIYANHGNVELIDVKIDRNTENIQVYVYNGNINLENTEILLNNSKPSVYLYTRYNNALSLNESSVKIVKTNGVLQSTSSTIQELNIKNSLDVSIQNSTIYGANADVSISGQRVTISNTLIHTPNANKSINIQSNDLTINDSILFGNNLQYSDSENNTNVITGGHDSNSGLNPLADNGGPTKTHSLKSGSPAINAGSEDGVFPDADQRGEGFKRLQLGRIDIGAFELQNTPPEFKSAPIDVLLVQGDSLDNTKFDVTDLDEQPLVFTLEGESPKDFSIDNEGNITFDTREAEGTYEFSVKVSDEDSEVLQAVKIVVVHPQSLSNVDNLNIKQGEVLQIQQLTVVDAQGKNLSFQLDETQESSHPKGFSVAPDGTINFDSKKAAPGTYTFDILISDEQGLIRTEQVTLVITPDFDALRPTTTADVVSSTDRELSLREAITLANNSGGASTIILEGEGTYLNTLRSQFEVRNQNLSIKTESPDVIATINGQNRSRIFYANRVVFELENVSLINGDDGFYGGGAIYANRSNVKLTNSTIYNTRGPNGSAIYANHGNVELIDVKIDRSLEYIQVYVYNGNINLDNTEILLNNSKPSVYLYTRYNNALSLNESSVKIVKTNGVLQSTSSTIQELNIKNSLDVSIQNSTIYGANADVSISGQKVTLSNTLIHTPNANKSINIESNDLTINDSILFSSKLQYSDSANKSNVLTGGHDSNSGLNPLADNGGLTKTHSLKAGSPAINAGSLTGDFPDADQRGEGFKRVVGGRIDIGAYEFSAFIPAALGGTYNELVEDLGEEGQTKIREFLDENEATFTEFQKALDEDSSTRFSAIADEQEKRLDGLQEFIGFHIDRLEGLIQNAANPAQLESRTEKLATLRSNFTNSVIKHLEVYETKLSNELDRIDRDLFSTTFSAQSVDEVVVDTPVPSFLTESYKKLQVFTDNTAVKSIVESNQALLTQVQTTLDNGPGNDTSTYLRTQAIHKFYLSRIDHFTNEFTFKIDFFNQKIESFENTIASNENLSDNAKQNLQNAIATMKQSRDTLASRLSNRVTTLLNLYIARIGPLVQNS